MAPASTPDWELLRRLPKAELHCHLDGSVRPQTLLELARESGKPMPRQDPQALAQLMLVPNGATLEEYLQRFDVTLSVMQTAAALERIAYELAEDEAREGVRYLEVRYAPILNIQEGLALAEAVEAPLRGLARAERDFGIVARLLICALRTLSADISLELAVLAVAYRGHGVVGFDLAGHEAGHPATTHAAAFAFAREHDLACTCHAGEGDGAASIRQAIHGCGVHRIGHGTRLFEDPQLAQYVNDRRITLEMCLTSNVQTGAAASYHEHPFRRYFDRGMNVVLNTDNRLMSGTTLTDEYHHAARSLGFSAQELGRVALNGFESAFLPWEARQPMIEAAKREMLALGVPAD